MHKCKTVKRMTAALCSLLMLLTMLAPLSSLAAENGDGYEEVLRFSAFEKSYSSGVIGGNIYADWTRGDNVPMDITDGHELKNLRLQLKFTLTKPEDVRELSSTWNKSGWIKLRSSDTPGENNYGWNLSTKSVSPLRLHTGENELLIPLTNAEGDGYDVTQTGTMDWTKVDRIIFVIEGSSMKKDVADHTLQVSYAAIVDIGEQPDPVPTIEMPTIFSDNMMFQQGKPMKVWGTAQAGESVQVTFGPEGQTGNDARLKGDVDGKDGVTSADALLALQAATQKITLDGQDALAADVDGKAGITSADALLILQCATQKIDSLGALSGRQVKTTTVAADGSWSVELDALDASYQEYAMEVTSTNSEGDVTGSKTISNILIGEVWVAAGQSNMQMPVSNDLYADKYAAAADNDHIRMFLEPNYPFGENTAQPLEPEDDVPGAYWGTGADDGDVLAVSAVGYHFAVAMQEKLDVPFGILYTPVGGSVIEAWISRDAIENDAEYKAFLQSNNKYCDEDNWPARGNRMSALFNQKIGPLKGYNVAGTIWYQGESNENEGDMSSPFCGITGTKCSASPPVPATCPLSSQRWSPGSPIWRTRSTWPIWPRGCTMDGRPTKTGTWP